MSTRAARTRNIALALLMPNFLGFLVFTAGPVVFSLIMAFTDWNLTKHNQFSAIPIHFIGFENFIRLFAGDETRYFKQFLGNTLFLMIGIPVGIALSLIGALLLDGEITPARGKAGRRHVAVTVLLTAGMGVLLWLCGVPPLVVALLVITGVIVLLGLLFGQTSFRTLMYLPHLTSGVAIFILWKALYRPETGPINMGLRPLLSWLTDAVTHSPAWLWQGAGWLVILAAVGLTLWALATIVVMLRYRDCTVLGGVLTLVGVAAVSVVLALLGRVIADLPVAAAGAEGLTPPVWLSSMEWSKPAIMLMGIFMAMGSNNMLMYLAALSNVPVSLKEAAGIDGANAWQTFWNVTWPQLAPTTFFIVIMSTIGGLQGGFDTARVMTAGGPAGSTTTLAYYLYQRGFIDFQLGLASAIAWTMFVMIFLLTLINWKFGNTMVND
jgi:multiple sugar transport system permease protein